MPPKSSPKSPKSSLSAKLSKAQRMHYRIGRGETGVLTFEPYKSAILPLWRFKTPALARQSSARIYDKFLEYYKVEERDGEGGVKGDFVGMDMCRKFLQMGMTRAARYANHPSGRKYSKTTGTQQPQSSTHKDAAEKREASLIFREVWEKAKSHGGYLELKERFLKEQREWDKSRKKEERERGRR